MDDLLLRLLRRDAFVRNGKKELNILMLNVNFQNIYDKLPSISDKMTTESHKAKEDVDSFSYVFPAIRGIQAGREYYVTMCPLRLIPRIFLFDEDEIPPQMKAQRTMNHSRIPRIADYIVANPRDYVFSSLTASIDGKVRFKPLSNEGIESKIGALVVPMDARFLINDGQHRRAAIEEALGRLPELGSETISVVFFIDAGLRRSQQMFSDLNQHAVRPTKSIGILYDHRDPMARLSLRVVEAVPVFKGLTELEKTTISNRSPKLFTLSSIYQANASLLGVKSKSTKLTADDEKLCADFWSEVTKNITEWRQIAERAISCSSLRRDYVHAHGVVLHALGIAGHDLVEQSRDTWKTRLEKLKSINWERSNAELWEGRSMIGGRMNKSQTNLMLTSNLFKNVLGVKLSAEEKRLEDDFMMLQRRHKDGG